MSRPVLNLKAILLRRSLAFGFIVANLVLIALLVLDMPLGSRASMLPDWLHRWAQTLTVLGLSGWILAGSAFVFFASLAKSRIETSEKLKHRAVTLKNMAGFMFIAVAGSGLAANLLKRAIGRARPEKYPDLGIFSFTPFNGSRFESFPSGHATTFGALTLVLCLLVPRYRIFFLAAGLWLSMTRVIIGAHYPSDVIAGFAFGIWCTVMLAYAFAQQDSVFRVNRHGWPVLKQPLPFIWKTRRL